MIIVLLADGFEEIEALTPVDMLRRAGLKVKTVGISGRAPTGAHGITVVCDALADEINLSEVKMAVFPGGMPGTLNLDASPFTDRVIGAVLATGGRLAAICAAPLIFGKRGLLEGKAATCYPGFEKDLIGAKLSDKSVVTDGKITTAKGMGVAIEFAAELISLTVGPEKAKEIVSGICKEDTAAPSVEKKPEPSVPGYRYRPDYVLNIQDLLPKKKEESPSPESMFKGITVKPDFSRYTKPSLELLSYDEETYPTEADEEALAIADKIINIYASYNITVSISKISVGPRIIRYHVVPARGIKVSSMLLLTDDLALGLGVGSIRMEAPIPGESAVGIEIPRSGRHIVRLRNLLESEEFTKSESITTVCLGRDVFGKPVIGDIAKMPHLLIGGATGMGKSVEVNSIISSLIYKASPEDLKLILIDPKQVELSVFAGIPHLITPIVTDPREAAGALRWAVEEMERRYKILSDAGVRNIINYNKAVDENPELGEKLPSIVIIVDELADLMLQVKDQIESLIMRIAQKARAAGIHLIVTTQRPSPNVITGVLKANIPSRLSFKVATHTDSKVLLDCSGAEKLMSFGDGLYSSAGSPKPSRIQCSFISDSETTSIANAVKSLGENLGYDPGVTEYIQNYAILLSKKLISRSDEKKESDTGLVDQQFLDAVDIAINTRKISTALIQRKLSIGYGKAAKYIDLMEAMGIVSEPNGQRPRDVLLSPEEWKAKLERISH